jgi:hypothetical protein
LLACKMISNLDCSQHGLISTFDAACGGMDLIL